MLTLPNLISLCRLGIFAWFLVLLFGTTHRVAAAALLGLAGATDFADGYVARRFHQVSTLGKVLDPTVDRVVVVGAIVASVAYGAVPAWFGGLVLGREVLTMALVAFIAAHRHVRVDVVRYGKIGTFGLMVVFPLLIAGDGPGAAALALRVLGWAIAVPSFAFACAATLAYFRVARRGEDGAAR